MNKTKWMTGSLMALALLSGGAACAQAFQPQQSYPQDQGDTPDDAQLPDDQPPASDGPVPEDRAVPPHPDDDFSDVAGAEQSGSSTQAERYGRQDDPAPADQASDEAITNCALAARDEAERDGGYAEVRQVQEPRETRNGYDVEGDVDVRSGWRTQDGRERHFTCSVENGRITDVTFGDRAAR